MTNSVNKFKWQSTAELVTAGNWASGDLGPSELTADSAVVMNGSSSWAWEVVSRSDAAGIICQRSESSQLKHEGETELEKKMKGKKWNDKITGKKIEIKDSGIDRVNETHTHIYIYIYMFV